VTEWTDLPTGRWEAWLDSPGGRLDCEMMLWRAGNEVEIEFINAAESVDLRHCVWRRTKLTLDIPIPHYDARIACVARADGLHLDGDWQKRAAPERWTKLPFHADYRGTERLYCNMAPDDLAPLPGRWRVKFDSNADPAVALIDGFKATFLTTQGDYRYLTGQYHFGSAEVTLSTFDGAHAFLFKAQLKEDGSLAGDFWSGDSWHETWTAVRDDNAKLPDPFDLTKWNENAKLDAISFPDLEGKQHALTEFGGKARMLVAFGSWCPNCNDEAEFLRELDEKYRQRGLSIVGLAFELTGDFARDAGQVKLYSERHKLAFPLLIAGTSDKAAASKAIPLLDKIRAYPTTIFLHADGRVRAVHQGYSGPATGAEHTKLREDFERLIDELLAESDTKR
jgi:peroxiredoxin